MFMYTLNSFISSATSHKWEFREILELMKALIINIILGQKTWSQSCSDLSMHHKLSL